MSQSVIMGQIGILKMVCVVISDNIVCRHIKHKKAPKIIYCVVMLLSSLQEPPRIKTHMLTYKHRTVRKNVYWSYIFLVLSPLFSTWIAMHVTNLLFLYLFYLTRRIMDLFIWSSTTSPSRMSSISLAFSCNLCVKKCFPVRKGLWLMCRVFKLVVINFTQIRPKSI